jgi:hypothetical protein
LNPSFNQHNEAFNRVDRQSNFSKQSAKGQPMSNNISHKMEDFSSSAFEKNLKINIKKSPETMDPQNMEQIQSLSNSNFNMLNQIQTQLYNPKNTNYHNNQ